MSRWVRALRAASWGCLSSPTGGPGWSQQRMGGQGGGTGIKACCPVPLHITPCSSTSRCLPALEQTQSLSSATGSCSPSLERARALLKPPSCLWPPSGGLLALWAACFRLCSSPRGGCSHPALGGKSLAGCAWAEWCQGPQSQKKKTNGLEPSLLLEGGDVQMSVCFEFKMELRAPLINPLFQATNWFVFPLTLP